MARVHTRWYRRWEFVVLVLLVGLAGAVIAPFISMRHRSAERRELVRRTMAEIRLLSDIPPEWGHPAETHSEGALIEGWIAAALDIPSAHLPPGRGIAIYKFEGLPPTILLILYHPETQTLLRHKIL